MTKKREVVGVLLLKLGSLTQYKWKIFSTRWGLDDKPAQCPREGIDGWWMVCENKDCEIVRVKRKLLDHVCGLVSKGMKRLEELRKELEER